MRLSKQQRRRRQWISRRRYATAQRNDYRNLFGERVKRVLANLQLNHVEVHLVNRSYA